MKRHKVAVVDGRRLIREGLAALLSTHDDIEIVAVADEAASWGDDVTVVVGLADRPPPASGRRVALSELRDVEALLAAVRARGVRGTLRVPGCDPPPLTARERAVLRAMSSGQSTTAIGATLGISPRTVERHVQSARAKLGSPNQTDVVAKALQLDLLGDAV